MFLSFAMSPRMIVFGDADLGGVVLTSASAQIDSGLRGFPQEALERFGLERSVKRI